LRSLVPREFSLKKDGIELAAGVVSIFVSSESLQQETPHYYSAEITIDTRCGLDLNPDRNPFWNAHATIEYKMANSGGVLVPALFGAQLKTRNYTIPKSRDPRNPETLVIHCLCDIGYSREPDEYASVAPVTMATGTTVMDLMNQYWNRVGLEFTILSGDINITRPTAFTITYPSHNANIAEHCWKIGNCNADNDGEFFIQSIDNLGRLRPTSTNLLTPTIYRTYNWADLNQPERIDDQYEQLPGRILGESVLTIITQLPTTDSSSTYSDDITQLTDTTIYGDTTTTLFEQERAVFDIEGETPEQKATRTNKVLSKISTYNKVWDGANRFSSSTNIVQRPARALDPTLKTSNLVIAERETVSVDYSNYNVMSSRRTVTKKAAGLTADEETDKSTLIDYESKWEVWRPVGNGRYAYTVSITNYVDKRLGRGGKSITNESNSQVPATETKPNGLDTYPRQLYAYAIVGYQPEETISGAIDLVGYGTLSGTISYFSGQYTHTSPTNVVTTGEGTVRNLTGSLIGSGQFRGAGTWTGTRRPLRDLKIDYQAYPGAWANLKRTCLLSSILTASRPKGWKFGIPIDDAMHDNGGLMPGKIFKIITGETYDEIYMMAAGSLELEKTRQELRGNFYLIGKMLAGGTTFIPIIGFGQKVLGRNLKALVDINGIAILTS
jgi:hypothetical protein